jgi:hypothetical protein
MQEIVYRGIASWILMIQQIVHLGPAAARRENLCSLAWAFQAYRTTLSSDTEAKPLALATILSTSFSTGLTNRTGATHFLTTRPIVLRVTSLCTSASACRSRLSFPALVDQDQKLIRVAFLAW